MPKVRQLDRFENAELHAELRELHPALPTSECDELADEAILAELLGEAQHDTEPQRPRPPRNDGRSRRASFKHWLRDHTPLAYAMMYDDRMLERLRRAELNRLARVRRAALAFCIECRNPLVASEHGFQFCPYERAGQHQKVIAALSTSTARMTTATAVAPRTCRPVRVAPRIVALRARRAAGEP